ncbi:MAG: class I SAM-dependent methyltransferase [Chloroflexota bacterium]|nr:class I SAM-dependent methyltransferase [Chloroflexota bacterium]
MYSLQQFGHMIRDTVRISAYEAALKRAVQPGSVVVDIGAGTGIFALMACQYGARHVYAIEPNPLITLGPEMAAANGYADRITFIRAMSHTIELPEKADLVIGDIRGRLPPFEVMVNVFKDARARFLNPGGRVIPERDTIYATFISDAGKYDAEVTRPWVSNPMGIKMDTVLPIITNTMMPDPIENPDAVLTAQKWATLDYAGGETTWHDQPFTWDVSEAMPLHFVAVWFDALLFDEIGFSNAPGAHAPQVYQRILLPLKQPIEVAAGERVTLELKISPFNDDYNFRWTTRVYADGATVPRIEYQQTTFYSLPLFALRKRAAAFVPQITSYGRMTARALTLMQHGDPLSAVAATLLVEFAQALPDHAAALAFVAGLSQHYSE